MKITAGRSLPSQIADPYLMNEICDATAGKHNVWKNGREDLHFAKKKKVRQPMPAAAMRSSDPPMAKKVNHEMDEMFGDVRVDSYYWLRDDSRSNPDVLSYLQQENDYADFLMSGTKHLEDQIYAEIRGRIKEDDISAPIRRGPYYYYERTLEGKEYIQHCRCLVSDNGAPPSIYDVLPTGPDAPPEHVILDENVKAQGHAFYSIDAFEVSPNNKLVAYAEDTKGDEIYHVYIIDAETGTCVGKPLVGVKSNIEWAGDDALLYVTMDATLRPEKVWLHNLGMEQSNDLCLYHEKDDMFSVVVEASESKKFLFIASESKTTTFVFYFDISKPENGLMQLTPRLDGIDTSVSHRGNHYFIKRRSDQFFNSELLACPLDNISATSVLLPHRESVKIQGIQLFKDHLVIYEREKGLPKVTIYGLPPIGEPLERLHGGRAVDFIDPVYSVDPSESQFSSSILRFSYSSLRTPYSVYDYDMNTGISVLKKIETVLGGFDALNYVTERQWATAPDGTQIPISIVYQRNIVKLDGSDPLLLSGYGSYEYCLDPDFKASRLSLLDRGFIYAIAHIRGGGEMGRQWYEDGKLLKKQNTFTDFIACAEYLIEKVLAGRLLIGAALNMRPDLFKVAVAEVPFVDVLTTMLDPTIPLTTSEWEFYFYMKSYSLLKPLPCFAQIKAQNYPAILVTAGLHGKLKIPCYVFEPAKFVAKLRDMKTDDNMLLFKCELIAGHSSKSGRDGPKAIAASVVGTIAPTVRPIADAAKDSTVTIPKTFQTWKMLDERRAMGYRMVPNSNANAAPTGSQQAT
ncbi:Protease 2 [Camellia lanceoleosa]|uniref:Protease 2 n=1 Tax=Camellia lanceoleosa TaxID=1840588 RepID=A0ACC0G1Z1_9ERIC|nr:Protease 2 [Camellia lanceoleosa]